MSTSLRVRKQTEKWYPQFDNTVSQEIKNEARLTWDALYSLRDSRIEILTLTLNANFILDTELVAGKPLRVILKQDAVGGRTISFTTKFKGTNLFTATTTANTYSVLDFEVISPTEALLVNHLTGGNLS